MVEYDDRIHEELEQDTDEEVIGKERVGTSCVIGVVGFDESRTEVVCFDAGFDFL